MYTSELVFKIYYLTLSSRAMILELEDSSAHIGEVEGMKKIKVYLILLCG